MGIEKRCTRKGIKIAFKDSYGCAVALPMLKVSVCARFTDKTGAVGAKIRQIAMRVVNRQYDIGGVKASKPQPIPLRQSGYLRSSADGA